MREEDKVLVQITPRNGFNSPPICVEDEDKASHLVKECIKMALRDNVSNYTLEIKTVRESEVVFGKA